MDLFADDRSPHGSMDGAAADESTSHARAETSDRVGAGNGDAGERDKPANRDSFFTRGALPVIMARLQLQSHINQVRCDDRIYVRRSRIKLVSENYWDAPQLWRCFECMHFARFKTCKSSSCGEYLQLAACILWSSIFFGHFSLCNSRIAVFVHLDSIPHALRATMLDLMSSDGSEEFSINDRHI